jgi:hypothetical protein
LRPQVLTRSLRAFSWQPSQFKKSNFVVNKNTA